MTRRSSGMLEGTEIDAKYVDLDKARPTFERVSQAEIPKRSGRGFVVDAGQVFRIVQVDGPRLAMSGCLTESEVNSL